MTYLTKIAGCPDRKDAVDGMAHFANGGPSGTYCRDCKHLGYKSAGKYRAGRAMYLKQTGQHGAAVSGYNKSCKYYEAKST